MFKKIYLTIAFIAIIASCALNPTSTVKPDPHEETIELSINQPTRLAWQNYTINFDTVYSEDRFDTTGSWVSGLAEIRLSIQKSGTETVYLDMSINSFQSMHSSDYQTIDTLGFLITLTNLDPQILPIVYKNYKATIEIVESKKDKVLLTNLLSEDIINSHYTFDTASITGDSLHIRIAHGGGCQDHYYLMYMSPLAFAKSQPVQADLYIRHFNNRDYCQAYLHPQLEFDLTSIKELYQKQYGLTGEILLNFYDTDYSSRVIKAQTLLYSF